MRFKELFCQSLDALRTQAQKISKLEEALEQPLEWFWANEQKILEALEAQCADKWPDEIWDMIFDSTVSTEEIYVRLEELREFEGLHKSPVTVGDLIGDFFSHNSIISLNIETADEDGESYLLKIWRGEAWKLEQEHPEYLNYKFVRFHEVVPESVLTNDLFIEVKE